MPDYGIMPQLFAVDCSNCGQPTVTSSICTRPDLCFPCFRGTTIPATGGE